LASDQLPAIAPWLAWRRSRVAADPATSVALLDSVPAAAAALAAATRPDLLLRLGDVAGAVSGFIAAGRPTRASEIALAAGDTAASRRYLYAGLAVTDTLELVRALKVALTTMLPKGPAEQLAVARASRVRDPRHAESYARRAVRGGDSSSAALLVWGSALLDV